MQNSSEYQQGRADGYREGSVSVLLTFLLLGSFTTAVMLYGAEVMGWSPTLTKVVMVGALFLIALAEWRGLRNTLKSMPAQPTPRDPELVKEGRRLLRGALIYIGIISIPGGGFIWALITERFGWAAALLAVTAIIPLVVLPILLSAAMRADDREPVSSS